MNPCLPAGTRWLRFVDDAEFWLDPAGKVIHVRAASRLGRRDFGVNRARIESIRARWNAANRIPVRAGRGREPR